MAASLQCRQDGVKFTRLRYEKNTCKLMYFNLKIHVAETNLTRVLYDGLIEMLAGVTLGTSTRV